MVIVPKEYRRLYICNSHIVMKNRFTKKTGMNLLKLDYYLKALLRFFKKIEFGVCKNICSSFPISCYRKIWTNFLANAIDIQIVFLCLNKAIPHQMGSNVKWASGTWHHYPFLHQLLLWGKNNDSAIKPGRKSAKMSWNYQGIWSIDYHLLLLW